MPTILGLLLLPLVLVCWNQPVRLAQLVLVASVFDAAAVAIFGSTGISPPLLPALFLVGLLVLRLLVGQVPRRLPQALWALAPGLLLAALAMVGAAALPRLFAGAFEVWPQQQPVPEVLRPSFGNVSQTAYLTLNMLLAVAAATLLDCRAETLRRLINAYLFSGWLAVALSLWQFASRLTGLPYAEQLLYSNPAWKILDTQIFAGVQRVNGPFVEPSALGYFFAGQIAACLSLVAHGHAAFRPRLLLLASAVVVVLSTSTTGLATMLLSFALFTLYALGTRDAAAGRRARGLLMAFGLASLLLLLAVVALVPSAAGVLAEIFTGTLSKTESESFVERSSMDADSLALLLRTYGLGAGWGSVRSSSLVPGLAANGGVLALGCIGWLAWRLMRLLRGAASPGQPGALALRAFLPAMLGFLAAALLSAPFLSAPAFYVMLGTVISAAMGERTGPAPAARPATA